ncbi:probable aminoacyl tRNA synthase complex-interacting multifunctional protein 2 isoform X1 [Anoplophora glabripennis]|uniref:probable aminoacyl tRNA synthase complex-interacting multifunctional protein 2 isoform X1 n=1 Tax=Anoplophora glabripennis TaxID=217634 RepID=UPI000873FB36|nr:probable aminoacyl tRNA synthase complex-interacting multifunctional protein 2 isoform X1 [Anoplophora glabripennis]
MNGPIKMYQTRRFVRHDIPVELPKCMYTLKNIHSRNGMVDGAVDHVLAKNKKLDIFDQVKQFLKNNHKIPGMAELEAKQEEILQQLAELKKQILSIKSDLKIAAVSTTKPSTNFTSSTCPKITINNLPDIVINANPSNPPYSLQIIQKLLQDTLALTFSTYLHSTVSSLSEEAKKLDSTIVNFAPKSNVLKLNIRLIWKTIDSNTELLVSHIPILGEVNMLRYLSRAVKSSLNYDSESDCIEIDSLLDICYLLVRARTKTERAGLLQTINKSLGKAQWLVGRSQASIADVAAYSAIRQATSNNEISANLGKWFQRCETVLLGC